ASVNWPTIAIGLGSLAFLYAARRYLAGALRTIGMPHRAAEMASRAAPILAVAATILLAAAFNLSAYGVALVGSIPQGLPSMGIPPVSWDLLSALAGPALLISIVGFVESVSVAQT